MEKHQLDENFILMPSGEITMIGSYREGDKKTDALAQELGKKGWTKQASSMGMTEYLDWVWTDGQFTVRLQMTERAPEFKRPAFKPQPLFA